MENYIMIDGKKIEISDETAKNFKEQFADKEVWQVFKGFEDTWKDIDFIPNEDSCASYKGSNIEKITFGDSNSHKYEYFQASQSRYTTLFRREK